jgi:hypothetical protein
MTIFLTAPGRANHIAVSARSPSSLSVRWDAPTGGVKGYSIILENYDGAFQEKEHDNRTRTATYNGLTAGTEYTARVITVSGGQKSERVENKFYTSTYLNNSGASGA